MLRALFYAYILGGLTFIPLVILLVVFITVYTSVPVGELDMAKKQRGRLEASSVAQDEDEKSPSGEQDSTTFSTNDLPTTRRGWLTMRRTFEESEGDTSYVTLVRSFLDARSKDPKRSRPKDMWYVVLKRNILYLYEDEEMTECEAAIELSGHDVFIYPEDLPDGELYAKRNAICLRRKEATSPNLPSVTKEMALQREDVDAKLEGSDLSEKKKEKEREALEETEQKKDAARDEAFNPSTPWFIFVRSNVEMEDWYFSLLHASKHPAQTPTLLPLRDVFDPKDMDHLVSTLDDQPDVIPMRWLNALLGRIFFSHYRTQNLESYIIGRLMKKLEKVKRPQFLSHIAVTEVSVGNRPPMLSKPMLKELTKEGDASLEIHFQYKGEIRLTVEATAVINLGSRFKSYTVKLVLAAILKELEGNLLVKVKRPPSNRIWYAFTQTPRMVLSVEPIVSDRQITWGMILSTIESKIKEIFQESVVMPNMDDIAFFDSLPYESRGGIYADASRHSHPVPFVTPPEMTDDAQSTASAPIPESSVAQPEPPVIQTSHSDTVIAVKSSNSSQATEVPSKESSKDNEDDVPDTARNNTRKKTWFSSVKSDEGNSGPSLSVPDLFARIDNSVKTLQAKTDDVKSEDERDTRRSRSRPTSISSVISSVISTTEQDNSSEHGSVRRSQSRHSERGKDETETEQGESTDGRQTRSSPTTPNARRTSSSSQKQRSPSPPSFFSTLKSKAGDKQALSNTAKEAMRKWGVNWGMKKESNANAGSDDSHEGTVGSPPRLNAGTANGNGPTHKPRASYAEVRAAVAERKEREKMEADGDRDRPVSPSNASANSRSKRSLSVGKLSDVEGATLSGNGSLASDTANSINPTLLAAAARLSPRLNPKKSSPSISRVNTDIDADELAVPAEAPIHVQPQAKTMSIPGIHASHRGEVMSLGYVAPPPPQPAPSSTTLESKLKNPAIQTVYRFWKSPSQTSTNSSTATTANQDHDAVQGSTSTSGSGGLDDEQGSSSRLGGGVNCDQPSSGSSSSHLAPQGVVRPTPPPLPPRSVPITGTGASTSTSKQNDVAARRLSASPTPYDVTGSPEGAQSASEVLLDIQAKHDAAVESRGNSLDLGQARSGSGTPSSREGDSHEKERAETSLEDVPRSESGESSMGKSQESVNTTGTGTVRTPPPLPPRNRVHAVA